VAVVEAAGGIVRAASNGGLHVDQKHGGDLVTNADREVDAFLKVELRRILPAAWLSEESADDLDRLGRDAVWIVDPLDGTREFAHGIAEYAIAVALVARGRPLLGVVHHPATGDSFWAAHGGGAFRNGDPIHVNEGTTLLASRSETARGEFAPLADTWTVRPMGSVQLKLALVAAAEAAVTLSRGPKHEWDVCAGALIVSEAGGFATDMFGTPLCYNQVWPKVKGILAGAPVAYRRALGQLGEIGPSRRMAEFADAPGSLRASGSFST
jgi:myo-inositol-1(or 4)-monophosphatase